MNQKRELSSAVVVFIIGWDRSRHGELNYEEDCLLGMFPKEIIKYILDFVYALPYPFCLNGFKGWKNREMLGCLDGKNKQYNNWNKIKLKWGVDEFTFYRKKVIFDLIEEEGKFRETNHNGCDSRICQYNKSRKIDKSVTKDIATIYSCIMRNLSYKTFSIVSLIRQSP